VTAPDWCPGAERLTPSSSGGTSTDFEAAGPHMVWHTTECPSGARGEDPDYWFNAMNKVLTSKKSEPTLLYDPQSDRLGQYFPHSQTARALQNDGSKRTNRTGDPCIQIEVVAYASRPFTRDWKPGENFHALGSWLEDLGVPYAWPSGFPPGGNTDERSDVYFTKPGHYGHSQVPGNSHWDPGNISVPDLFAALGQGDGTTGSSNHPGAPGSLVWPGWLDWPGYDVMGAGKHKVHDMNLLVSAALAVNGYAQELKKYVDRNWTRVEATALDDFKSKKGIREGGIGPDTWAALGQMPRETAPAYPGEDAFAVGARSLASLKLQALMVLQGFSRPLKNRADATWSVAARRAVRRFQLSESALSGAADGVPGPLTWKLAWTDNT
jgi:hypothetical protein